MNQEYDDDKTRAHVILSKGVKVSHYQIDDKIGAGGMGEVYAAEDSSLGRRIALKFLPSLYSTDDAFRERFKREAEATARLNHPNIVTIHEVGEHQDRPYFAMELVEGQSLKQYFQKGDLSLETILDLAIQICDGLAAAHDNKVTHRDIKPSNILIDSYGRPKILDFGLATIEGTEALTRTGSTLGTIQYMSPEQTQGSGVDHRTDLFSFGVVLYEMITGRNPFARDNTIATGQAIVSAMPEPLSKYRNDVPDLLQAVISKMLEKDPALRYQSAIDIVADLKRMVRDVDSGESTRTMTDMSTPSTTGRKSRLGIYVASAAILLIVVVSAAFWLPSPMTGGSEEAALGLADSEWKNSIAVLPFRDFSSTGDQEFFCDGITDAIIGRLSGLSDLKVISMTSVMRFKSPDRDLTKIGNELGVAAILEGSVQKEGDRIRIRAQLISVKDDAHLWSDTYDKEVQSVFAVQDDISHAIVGAMKIELLGSEQISLARQSTDNLEAYNHYSQGRFFWRKRSEEHLRTAIESLEKAVELDSNYALAWSGLADAWMVLPGYSNLVVDEVLDTARWAANRALALDQNLSEAHASLALILGFEENHEEAEQEFLRAIELNPGYVWAHTWYATSLTDLDRDDDAIRELEVSLELDPLNTVSLMKVAGYKMNHFEWDAAAELYQRAINIEPSPAIIRNYAELLTRLGRYDEAIALLEQAIEDFPLYTSAYRTLGQLHEEFGRLEKTEEVINKYISNVGDTALGVYWRGNLNQNVGRFSLAAGLFQQALDLNPDHEFIWINLATSHINMGQPDKAIEAINHYVSASDGDANSLIQRGFIFLLVGDLQRALDNFQEAYERDPDHGEVSLRIGVTKLYMGDNTYSREVVNRYSQMESPERRAEAGDVLTIIELFQGHVNDALRLLDSCVVADSLSGRLFEMRGKLLLKTFLLEELGQLEDALREARRIITITRVTSPQDQLAWKDYEIQILAKMGRYDEARQAAESLKNDIVASGRALDISAYIQASAAIDMAAGDYSSALEKMTIACDSVFFKGSTNYIQARCMLAQAYLGAGRVTEAIAEFEDLLGTYSINRLVCEVWMFRARYLLGTAYEQAGRTADARSTYESLLDQFKNADPNFGLVNDVRARLAQLQS